MTLPPVRPRSTPAVAQPDEESSAPAGAGTSGGDAETANVAAESSGRGTRRDANRPTWHLDAGDVLSDASGPRWEIRETLGAGAHGVVYRAWDRQTERDVALKTLLRDDPEHLLRFRNEFRTLTDVSHPNLVTLFDFALAEVPLYTMELVEGVSFLEWVRDDAGFEEGRLRRAVVDVARGLASLHASGRLHRDLKPSNVLVATRGASRGQAKVADFGLALRRREADAEDRPAVVGTPLYMSPEQAAAMDVGPPSDLYSLGVILYEALVGEAPYPEWTGIELLMRKQIEDPPPPSVRLTQLGGNVAQANVPPDLDRLCMDLLERDPRRRPSCDAVLQRLGLGERDELTSTRSTGSLETFFLGRRSELRELHAALDGVLEARARGSGQSRIVWVTGRSGIGKSALVERFAEELRRRPAVEVHAGRCFEREAVAYKGVDAVVEGVRAQLLARRLPGEAEEHAKGRAIDDVHSDTVDARTPWPTEIPALTQVFPILADVAPPSPHDAPPAEDPLELRRQAIRALRGLLNVASCDAAQVVLIDDAQWIDADGAAWLGELFSGPGAATALLVFVVRKEAEDARGVADLRDAFSALRVEGAESWLELGPLSEPESTALARSRGADAALAKELARECEGNPLLLAELVRYQGEGASAGLATRPAEADVASDGTLRASGRASAPGEAAARRLETVTVARARRLPTDARELLEVIALAGEPIPQSVAIEASGTRAREQERFALLRSESFIRTAGAGRLEVVDVIHDRIRVAIAEDVANRRDDRHVRDVHRRIADGLARIDIEPERLARHYEAAGESLFAGELLVKAATAASAALAFHHAANLLRRAAKLLPASHAAQPRVAVMLADALASDGRPRDAGRAYVEAVALAGPGERMVLRQRAADQLLRAGSLDEGFALLDAVLRSVGIRLHRTPALAVLSLLWLRLRIWWGGLRHQPRDESEVSSRDLLRIDTCWAAATNVSGVNVIIGQELQARHLLLALAAGEKRRVARALSMEALYAATNGDVGATRTRRVLDVLQRVASRADDPHVDALQALAEGAFATYCGAFSEAVPKLAEAERTLATRCTNVTWELGLVRTFIPQAMYYLGDFDGIVDVSARGIEDAIEREDLHSELLLRTAYGPFASLCDDDVDAARAEFTACVSRGQSQMERTTFQYIATLFGTRLELYAGDGEAAWRTFDAKWKAIRRSFILVKQPVRIYTLVERMSAALAAAHVAGAVPGARRQRLLGIARGDLRRVQRERTAWGDALAGLAEASLAAAEGRGDDVVSALTKTRARCETLAMAAHAAAAHVRLGEWKGGAEGEEVRAKGLRELRNLGAKEPLRMAKMLAPPVIKW